MCLQFVPMSLMIWVVTCITLATNVYCSTSNSGHFAKIWITVAKVAVTTLAVLADLRLYKAKYEILKPHGVLSKFFAFKGIIGLNMIQRVRLPTLTEKHGECERLTICSWLLAYSWVTKPSIQRNTSRTTMSTSDSHLLYSRVRCRSSPSWSPSLFL
jgi:hypothetical protein